MSELKPCPRCGAEAHVVTEDGEPTMFLCEDCGSWLDVSEFETTENAFKWWNDRPFIDALNNRIAELEAAQRWIPVSERLPEDGETVFVIIYDGFERFENGNEVARLTYLGNGNWWSWESERYVVTHWMPLPELPNDTQKDTVVYGKERER